MKRLLAMARAFLASRTQRERWILGAGAVSLGLVALLLGVIRPLQAAVESRRAEVARSHTDLQQALRLARGVRQLQAIVREAETRIEPGAKTNLFTLLEAIAQQAQIKDRLESIKPKQPSTNPAYPETRVELVLKGATLEQTMQLLYRIDTAPAHLIIRSLRIKSRPDGSNLLDVSISVSSFERA